MSESESDCFFIAWIVSFPLSSRWFILESLTEIRDKVLASFWSPWSSFVANNRRQQLWMKVAPFSFVYHHCSIFAPLFIKLDGHQLMSLISSSCYISLRIRHRLLVSFLRTLISLFLSLWYHLSFWILFFCHNTLVRIHEILIVILLLHFIFLISELKTKANDNK